MQKQAPTAGRLAVMVVFALSCFGLLVFLWSSFGGTLPLRPKGYEIRVGFPEAAQLSENADVRISGVPVGKVRRKSLDKGSGRTVATLELDDRYAPLPSDVRAVLRQKTLLGETYVELTPGSSQARPLPEGARLPDARVQGTVQLDEIFSALDRTTRAAFKSWQRSFGRAVAARGADLNEATGTLPQVLDSGERLLRVLDADDESIRALTRNTGIVFEAVTSDEDSLRSVITNSASAFGETARHRARLAQTIRILPTFLTETRATLRRTSRFAGHADPLVRELRPALAALRPAAADLAAFSPDLRRFAGRLDPLVRSARTGLPAGTEVVRALGPVLANAGPLLSELNPILEWLEYNQRFTIGVLTNAAVGLVDTTDAIDPESTGHFLPSLSPAGLESIAVYRERLKTNRGNSYLSPSAYAGPRRAQEMALPSWDCKNTGRGAFTTQKRGTNDDPSCWTQGFPGWPGGEPGKFPHIERADYSRQP